MAFSIGSFFARLGIDTGEYSRGLLNAQTVTRTFGNTFAAFVANPVLGGITALNNFGRAAFRTLTETAALGEAIERLAAQTGLSVETIQALQAQFKEAGFNAESATGALVQFANRLGEVKINGAAAADLFRRIGVDLSGVGDTEEGLRRALDAINAMPTAAERAAAAADLFGRFGGTQIVNAVGGGSEALDGLIERFRRLGLVANTETISALSKTGDVMDTLTSAIEGVKRTAAGEFLLGISGQAGDAEASVVELTNEINNNLGPVMRELGETLADLIDRLDEYREGVGVTRSAIDVLDTPARLIRENVLVPAARAIYSEAVDAIIRTGQVLQHNRIRAERMAEARAGQ